MATKTVTLTGAEQRVDELGGLNALIVNNTDAPLYASAKAGIEPYADGVIEIKAGASRGLPDTNGTVYLLGNGGRAELTGTSASVNFSVPSSSSEGGGGITRDEVNDIVTGKIAEVVANAPEDFDTLREIADWIDGHEDSAAAMNSEIKANAADISSLSDSLNLLKRSITPDSLANVELNGWEMAYYNGYGGDPASGMPLYIGFSNPSFLQTSSKGLMFDVLILDNANKFICKKRLRMEIPVGSVPKLVEISTEGSYPSDIGSLFSNNAAQGIQYNLLLYKVIPPVVVKDSNDDNLRLIPLQTFAKQLPAYLYYRVYYKVVE